MLVHKPLAPRLQMMANFLEVHCNVLGGIELDNSVFWCRSV
ncbi:hypothetical protein OIU77_022360 [Salix suchowensis]|uniref:Uncharacterized protein n=1 Tax=Salix suchowensis TaxID=1278906 RepID=A0ABQ9C3C4_9ROSI|nr:hypothetical protein OIU77_022360 [Salix suchowensis]